MQNLHWPFSPNGISQLSPFASAFPGFEFLHCWGVAEDTSHNKLTESSKLASFLLIASLAEVFVLLVRVVPQNIPVARVLCLQVHHLLSQPWSGISLGLIYPKILHLLDWSGCVNNSAVCIWFGSTWASKKSNSHCAQPLQNQRWHPPKTTTHTRSTKSMPRRGKAHKNMSKHTEGDRCFRDAGWFGRPPQLAQGTDSIYWIDFANDSLACLQNTAGLFLSHMWCELGELCLLSQWRQTWNPVTQNAPGNMRTLRCWGAQGSGSWSSHPHNPSHPWCLGRTAPIRILWSHSNGPKGMKPTSVSGMSSWCWARKDLGLISLGSSFPPWRPLYNQMWATKSGVTLVWPVWCGRDHK